MSAQRNTRLLGTFARLNRRDGKPQYLKHQPRIWTYLTRSLAHPALAGFRDGIAPTFPRRLPDLPLVSHPVARNLDRVTQRRAARPHPRAGTRPWQQNGAGASALRSNAASRAHMMGIDGTWRRDCIMEDVSETGAKLTVEGSVEGLHLKEFFLLLSSTGLAYRRCELAWVNGDQIGVNFLKQGDKEEGRAAARQPRPEARSRRLTAVMSPDYGVKVTPAAQSP